MPTQIDKDFLNEIDGVDELISSPEKLDDEVLICECFCVNVADIREACSEKGSFDLETMQNRFNMGQGCRSCINRIDTWVNKIF